MVAHDIYGVWLLANYHFTRITIVGVMEFLLKKDTWWAEAGNLRDTKLYEMGRAELEYESNVMGYSAIISNPMFTPISEMVKFINTYPDAEFQRDVKQKFSLLTSFLRNGMTTPESFFTLFDQHNVMADMTDYIDTLKEYYDTLSKSRKPTFGKFTGGTSGMSSSKTNNYRGGNSGTIAARLAEEARLAEIEEEEAAEEGYIGDTTGNANKSKKETKPPATSTVTPPWAKVTWYPTDFPNVLSSNATKYEGLVPVSRNAWLKVTAENRTSKMMQELVYRYSAVKEPCVKCSDVADPTKHHKGAKCYVKQCFKCKLYGHQAAQCLQL
jgi:hypothetical protein